MHLAQCDAKENHAIARKEGIKVAPFVKVFGTNYEIMETEQKAIRNSTKSIVEMAEKCLLDGPGCG